MTQQLYVERTGKVFSVAGSEFVVTFPDGTSMNFWSPPWHQMEYDEEMEKAVEYAEKMWDEKNVDTDKEDE